MKRALILDLDNTIYPVSSVADDMFDELFKMIDEGMDDQSAADAAKAELTRRPFQYVADEHGFSPELKDKGMAFLSNLTYSRPMQPYNEYDILRNINIDKYLVTTGFTKLQMSKVNMLQIEPHFKQVFVVDPCLVDKTKKDIFAQIMQINGYDVNEVLVIGDDPESEIKAATELGIDTFLFDPENKYPHANVTYRGKDYSEVVEIVER